MLSPTTAQDFEQHRGHLTSVAYRLTGSFSDAQDAVQEAWIRLQVAENTRGDELQIRELRGWLTTVVGRICLDHLKSAAVRRESYVGQWLPEPIVTLVDATSGTPSEIGRAHVSTPVTNAHHVCRLLLEKKNKQH